MIRKSIKYITIAVVNILILSVLLCCWTDFIEITFNNWVRPIEFLKLIGITMVSLIAMRIAVSFFRKTKVDSVKTRLIFSILITLLISSYFYIDYSKKIYDRKIVNLKIRKSLANKIEPTKALAYGSKANKLTFEEYEEITKIKWFPKIQKEAENIDYYYTYDGFLPDYTFNLSYEVPLNIKIDTTELKYGKIQIDTIKNVKRIKYGEYRD